MSQRVTIVPLDSDVFKQSEPIDIEFDLEGGRAISATTQVMYGSPFLVLLIED
ncbi:hypothetical protein [Aeromicrobium sp. IC_218]|uniref:hypothetical protein n=1 Tax=Aeromicrobium sp. IC_218 TaxID=2545468 RepID=UPI0013F4AEA7|nr:hypothetical protein [Aeromicrobium sp. IC_218]